MGPVLWHSLVKRSSVIGHSLRLKEKSTYGLKFCLLSALVRVALLAHDNMLCSMHGVHSHRGMGNIFLFWYSCYVTVLKSLLGAQTSRTKWLDCVLYHYSLNIVSVGIAFTGVCVWWMLDLLAPLLSVLLFPNMPFPVTLHTSTTSSTISNSATMDRPMYSPKVPPTSASNICLCNALPFNIIYCSRSRILYKHKILKPYHPCQNKVRSSQCISLSIQKNGTMMANFNI